MNPILSELYVEARMRDMERAAEASRRSAGVRHSRFRRGARRRGDV